MLAGRTLSAREKGNTDHVGIILIQSPINPGAVKVKTENVHRYPSSLQPLDVIPRYCFANDIAVSSKRTKQGCNAKNCNVPWNCSDGNATRPAT